MAQNSKVGNVSKMRETEELKESGFNQDQIASLIQKTTSSVLEGLAPYLNKGAEPQAKQTGDNVRKRVVQEWSNRFDQVKAENDKFIRSLAATPKSELVPVKIPQMYRNYFGSQLPVGLNGSIITIPINGRTQYVPKALYNIIARKLEYEDSKIAFMQDNENSDVRYADRTSLGV